MSMPMMVILFMVDGAPRWRLQRHQPGTSHLIPSVGAVHHITLSRLIAIKLGEHADSGSDARRCTPCIKSFGTEPTLRCGCDEMAADIERVVDSGMHGEELLSGSS